MMRTGLLSVVLISAVFIGSIYGGQTCTLKQPRNCADIKRLNTSSSHGVYTVYTGNYEPLTVYCIFEHGFGYTFVSPGNTATVLVSELSRETSHVMVRHRTTSGVQKEAKIEQITPYSSRPISVQYSQHDGFAPIQNTAMAPYMYVGLLPISGIDHLKDTQGYKSNGEDYTFVNCDGNPNSYFAFLFNRNNAAPTYKGPHLSTVTTGWVNSAANVPEDRLIPDDFFSSFEIHMGGCGAYIQEEQMASVTGAALGLYFAIDCGELPPIPHGSVSSTGSEFNDRTVYTCNSDHVMLSGDATRICTGTGEWSGIEPICGESTSYSPWSDWTLCQQSRQRTLESVVGHGMGYENLETVTRTCGPSCLPKSCRDVDRVDGIHTLFNRKLEPYTVFCAFEEGYGHTYLAPSNVAQPSIEDIFEDESHAMIRTRSVDGTQKEVRIEQISDYKSFPLSVQYTSNQGYNPPLNQNMKPFTYLGLLPIAGITHLHDKQGYKANGKDYTFQNCDGNPNSYFAFLHNHNDNTQRNYGGPNKVMDAWINSASAVSTKIPPSFFSFFEVHMGGCGGFASTNHYPSLRGAALGLRFEL